ncbi:MAG: hypothetical protein IJT26_07995 [Bacteroidales bacterium]|nr:hypothetical protein [Bacteroidales bacterium]
MKVCVLDSSIAAVILLLLISCGSRPVNKESLATDNIEMSTLTSFGIDLFKHILQIEGNTGEILISPLSASAALGMLAVGAQGETREQIVKTLGLNADISDKDLLMYYQHLFTIFPFTDTTTLSLANAVWWSYPLKNNYVKTTESVFKAHLEEVDFANAKSAALIINNWTADKTRNRILEIVTETDVHNAGLVLENALFFNSPWKDREPLQTRNLHYNAINGKRDKRPFVYASLKNISYFSDDTVSVVRIPYQDNKYCLVVALPKCNYIDFITSLNNDNWTEWRKRSTAEDIELRIPCFQKEYKMDNTFQTALKNKGMILPFTPFADFSNMLSSNVYNISRIIQKCNIKVDEQGTEAAAATVTVIEITSPMNVKDTKTYFIADHPFIFAVENRQTGDLLMIGTHCY